MLLSSHFLKTSTRAVSQAFLPSICLQPHPRDKSHCRHSVNKNTLVTEKNKSIKTFKTTSPRQTLRHFVPVKR